ncbi:MAG: hypothetical protein PHV02_03190 [Rhodocyclaceae bacterium]|nr:hypothetical protein [Rhodocyclaceae bacterium]
MRYFSGYLATEEGRIQFDFAVSDNATEQEVDALALAALSEKARIDYLEIGSDSTVGAGPAK